jgi:hypothetical protein
MDTGSLSSSRQMLQVGIGRRKAKSGFVVSIQSSLYKGTQYVFVTVNLLCQENALQVCRDPEEIPGLIIKRRNSAGRMRMMQPRLLWRRSLRCEKY